MPLHPPEPARRFRRCPAAGERRRGIDGTASQQGRRGTHWWLAANVILAIGLVLQATVDPSARRARSAPPAPCSGPSSPSPASAASIRAARRACRNGPTGWPRLAALVTGGTWLAPFEFATSSEVFAAAAFALTVYAAVAVSRLEDFATSTTLRTLRLGLVASAIAQIAGRRRRRLSRHGARPGDVALGAMLATGRRPAHDPALARDEPRAPHRPPARLATEAQATWSTSTR